MSESVYEDPAVREAVQESIQTTQAKRKMVVVLSGGMDSAALLWYMLSMNYDCIPVSFNYGQRHKKELEYAQALCKDLGLQWRLIDLTSLTEHIGTSALTSNDIDVPEGHYAAESMKATVVPNRNMIMLSIAAGIAVAEGAVGVATGIHSGDHAIYPDCRDVFRHSVETSIRLGNDGFISTDFAVHAPFVSIEKKHIVSIGSGLGLDFKKTWSCYKGGEKHCGRCGTCVERKEAFVDACVIDPTEYELLDEPAAV